MKKKLLLISYLILSKLIHAQNFQPGYVLLNNGDSLRGYINNLGWQKNPESIEFKETMTSSLKYYVPGGSLKEFRIDEGSYYVSRIQVIDKSEHRDEMIYRKRLTTPAFVKDTVFLEVRVKGKISLYKLIDENEKVHYFIDADGKTEELILKKVFNNERHTILITPLYRNQLSQHAASCSNLKQKEVNYKDNSLTDYVVALNGCKNQEPDYLKRMEKSASEFSVAIGVSASKVDFNFADVITYPQVPNDFPVSISPAALFTGNIVFPTLRKKWSLVFEAAYKGFKSKSKSDGGALEIHYGRINLAYRFTEPEKRKFFCQVGMTNGLALKYSANKFIEDGFRKHEIGAFAGTGYWITKKAGLEIRFERTRGFSQYLLIKTPVTAGYLFFNYKL